MFLSEVSSSSSVLLMQKYCDKYPTRMLWPIRQPSYVHANTTHSVNFSNWAWVPLYIPWNLICQLQIGYIHKWAYIIYRLWCTLHLYIPWSCETSKVPLVAYRAQTLKNTGKYICIGKTSTSVIIASFLWGCLSTELSLLNFFAISLPSQPFLGRQLGFHRFFHNGLLGATHFFYSWLFWIR